MRAVVEDEELEVGEVLPQNALDRLGEKALSILDAHHDTDGGGGGRSH